MASSDQSESPLHLPEPSSSQGQSNQPLVPVNGSSVYGAPGPIIPLPPGLAAPPDVKSLAKALKRHWLLAATLGILAAAAASSAAWYFMPVRYTGEATIIFNKTKLLRDDEGASPFDPQTLAQLVTQRWVIQKALDESNVAKLPSVREQLYPVEWLRRGVKATYNSPELMTITLSGYNPAELVILVDAISRSYAQELGSMERAVRLDRLNKINQIIEKLTLFVDREKKDFREWVAANGPASTSQRQNIGDFDRMRRERLLQQKMDALALLDKLKLEDELNPKNGPRLRESEVREELQKRKEITELKAKIDAEEKKLEGRKLRGLPMDGKVMKENLAEIQKYQDELKATEKKLTPEVRKELAARNELIGRDHKEDNQHELAATVALIKMIDDRIAEVEKIIKNEGTEIIDIRERLRRFDAEDRVLDTYRTRKAGLQAESENTQGTARVEGPPVAIPEAVFKKQIMLATGAGGGALALVLFVIAYWEFRARRINNAEDVVHGLGWRLVGQLPPLPERSRPGLLRRNGDAQYLQNLMTESVDATRTMILHAARVEGLRTVMVTSAVSGEGKTSLSCHLACSLARAGRKTLLLDCDMRNPAAHRLFELPAEPGLCEVLRGEVRLDEVIRATPATNLWLIPAGQFDEQALQTFTLSQDGFSPLLEQLKTQFDFIVIDSSPVLPVVDTLVVGQNVDVVVFSLLRDVSRIPSVYAAYQRLATLGIRILGAVVNGVDTGSYGYSRQYAKQTV